MVPDAVSVEESRPLLPTEQSGRGSVYSPGRRDPHRVVKQEVVVILSQGFAWSCFDPTPGRIASTNTVTSVSSLLSPSVSSVPGSHAAVKFMQSRAWHRARAQGRPVFLAAPGRMQRFDHRCCPSHLAPEDTRLQRALVSSHICLRVSQDLPDIPRPEFRHPELMHRGGKHVLTYTRSLGRPGKGCTSTSRRL